MLRSIYFFVIGAFVGWMLECTFKFFSKNYRRTPGILNTPFCILYGVGTVVLSDIISRVTSNFGLLFTLSFITLTSLEYITYILLQNIYGIRLWDYTEMKLNINGKICIEFAIIWGILGACYIKYLLPILNNLYNIARGEALTLSLYILSGIILFDFLYSSYILIKEKREYEYEN